MSEQDWKPLMKGVIGLKLKEYERLKAGSKRLEDLMAYLRADLDEFESDPIERMTWKDYERGYTDCLKDALKKLEEQDHE